MEAKDLMIGDWVYMDKDDIPRTISDIDRFGTVQSFSIARYVNNIYPIPLTPEILEKNGFDINGIPEDMVPVEDRDWSDDTYVWSKPETPDEKMQVSVYMDDPYNFFIEIFCLYGHVDGIHVKFVHELQHALRLCGIEKEITV